METQSEKSFFWLFQGSGNWQKYDSSNYKVFWNANFFKCKHSTKVITPTLSKQRTFCSCAALKTKRYCKQASLHILEWFLIFSFLYRFVFSVLGYTCTQKLWNSLDFALCAFRNCELFTLLFVVCCFLVSFIETYCFRFLRAKKCNV